KLAAGGSQGTIQVWRTSNTELLLKINAHDNWVKGVLWSPDGQQLVSASTDKTIKFWDSSNGCRIGQPCTGHTHWIYSLAISSDGSFIATASHDMTVRLWSTKSHQQIGQALEHTSYVFCVAISPSGELLASGDWYGNL
ncbi:beta transducin-like protein, partial [Suillus hirtellus]